MKKLFGSAGFPILWLIVPALIFNTCAFLLPIVKIGSLSFYSASGSGSIIPGLTLSTWMNVLGDPYTRIILFRSVYLSVIISIIALVISYPISLLIYRAKPKVRNILIVVSVSPLLLSAIVRTYGWVLILSNDGFLSEVLRQFGVTNPPRLIFNQFGIVVGLTHILMPYMILSLLAGFGRMEKTYEEAASSLGAPPFTVFRRILLPITLPGIILGCMLTFVLALSSFVTPKILGGGRVFMLATEIYDQAMVTMNWPAASVLSVSTLVIFSVVLLLYGKLMRSYSR